MVALVTGAARGIGCATATALARAGWDVAINYCHSTEAATALALRLTEDYGVRALAVHADVADSKQVAAMVAEVERVLGRVELLVNNAGVSHAGLITETTDEQWDRLFDVDVRGVFLCSREVLGGMVRERSGSIISISSIWGICGASCEVAYSAAKAAVIGFSKALAKEVGLSGIRVNCIAPGYIATEMNAALDSAAVEALREETPLGLLGTPEDVAAMVLFLAGEGGRFVTGQVLSPNGGLVI